MCLSTTKLKHLSDKSGDNQHKLSISEIKQLSENPKEYENYITSLINNIDTQTSSLNTELAHFDGQVFYLDY